MFESINSHLRVFLSADLVGSTKLKNRLNHQELLAKYRTRQHVIEKLRRADGNLAISDSAEETALLESLGVSTDDFDWATVVRNFYQGIHTTFVSAIADIKPDGFSESDYEKDFKPWKAVGDELIYEVQVRGRQALHEVTIAFLQAIREMDRKVSTSDYGGGGLRIKGAAWVAGFPVRNRRIELPPDGRADYLGPDMDTGFRIGKCTRSGMLVASVELAELLGECQAKFAPMLAKIVGWEELKGVWNDQRYPVIWVDFPDSHPSAKSHSAQEFSVWDQEDCRWCKAWENSEKKRQLSDISHMLHEIRGSLPKSLGLVNPYIVGDKLETYDIDSDHKQILGLLKRIEDHKADIMCQDSPLANDEDLLLEEKKAEVQNLMKRSLNTDPTSGDLC